jgi:hypothetical protein
MGILHPFFPWQRPHHQPGVMPTSQGKYVNKSIPLINISHRFSLSSPILTSLGVFATPDSADGPCQHPWGKTGNAEDILIATRLPCVCCCSYIYHPNVLRYYRFFLGSWIVNVHDPCVFFWTSFLFLGLLRQSAGSRTRTPSLTTCNKIC